MEFDPLQMIKKVKVTKEKKLQIKKRGNNLVKFYNIKKKDLINDFHVFSKTHGKDYTKDQLKDFLDLFQGLIRAYAFKSINEKATYEFDFLDDKFKINFHDSRVVRNPRERTTFMAEEKVQVRFINKRQDKSQVEEIYIEDADR